VSCRCRWAQFRKPVEDIETNLKSFQALDWRRLLYLHHKRFLLHWFPETLLAIRKDQAKAHASSPSAETSRMGRNEENNGCDQHSLPIARHGATVLHGWRSSEPDWGLTVPRLQPILHTRIRNCIILNWRRKLRWTFMRTLYVCDSGHHICIVCVCVCVCVFLEEKDYFSHKLCFYFWLHT